MLYAAGVPVPPAPASAPLIDWTPVLIVVVTVSVVSVLALILKHWVHDPELRGVVRALHATSVIVAVMILGGQVVKQVTQPPSVNQAARYHNERRDLAQTNWNIT